MSFALAYTSSQPFLDYFQSCYDILPAVVVKGLDSPVMAHSETG
jgi:hypothetical protein